MRIYVNNLPVEVPARVGSWEALCQWLKVPEGYFVALECKVDLDDDPRMTEVMELVDGWVILGQQGCRTPGEIPRFWEFHNGERYRLVPPDPMLEETPSEPWQTDPEAWRG